MKIQCDVCNKKEASVFCTADEASLCDVCDHRVHHANKLASKHHRLSLLQSSTSHPPLCDICQDKRAVIFCQEDRAILCRECDIPLHSANEYTQRHNRFLLTGIKLSTTTLSSTTPNDNTIINESNDIGFELRVPDHFKPSLKNTTIPTICSARNNIPIVISDNDDQINNNNTSSESTTSTSNISDYLIETLPGWHFDDFILDPPSSNAPFGYSTKNGNNNDFGVNEEMFSFLDVGQQQENGLTNYTTQFDNIWVPQAPQATKIPSTFGQASIFDSTQNNGLLHFGHFGTNQQLQVYNNNNNNNNNNDNNNNHVFKATTNKNINRKLRRRDDVLAVPQIIPSSFGSSKRSRPFVRNLG